MTESHPPTIRCFPAVSLRREQRCGRDVESGRVDVAVVDFDGRLRRALEDQPHSGDKRDGRTHLEEKREAGAGDDADPAGDEHLGKAELGPAFMRLDLDVLPCGVYADAGNAADNGPADHRRA